MNITLETYSLILSIGLSLALALTVLLVVGYMYSARVRNILEGVEYFHYLLAIGLATVAAVFGALVYEYVYETAVCELCWYQRVFIIPIAITALAGAYWRIYKAELVVMLLAAFGFVVALYHYYLHYQAVIRDLDVISPCGGGGLLPSCADTPILVWGFVTIPLMSLVFLGIVLVFGYFAYQRRG